LRRGDGTLVSETDGLHGSGYAYADVRSGDALYWRLVSPNLYELMRHNNNSEIALPFTAPVPFPVLWSPRADGQVGSEEFIGLLSQPDNTISVNLYFISNGDVFVLEIYRGAMSRYVDWESGIDLRFMIPTIDYDCLNPDPSAQPSDVINLCIAELGEYGIIAYADGLPTSHPNACATWTLNDGTTVYNQPWTLEELQQVMVGVKNTAKAFYMLKNNLFASSPEAQSLTGDSAEEKQIFRTVMDAVPTSEPCNGQIVDVDGFYILRVQNNFKYNNASEYCDRGTADKACTSNSNHAIAFYEGFYPLGLDFIQYTFVHELGHRFDNQSGISSDNLTTRGSQTITDCSSAVVMGYIPSNTESRNDWLRGNRGWGDINTFSNIPTYFQQNTLSITFPGPESRGDDGVERKENQTPEISEAMADMFLNWVHRRITDKVVVLQIQRDATTQTSTVVTDECAPLNIPDVTWANVEQNVDFSWDGFRNIQIPVNNNNHDSRLPGNARYWWMTASMDDIFRDSNWSGNE